MRDFDQLTYELEHNPYIIITEEEYEYLTESEVDFSYCTICGKASFDDSEKEYDINGRGICKKCKCNKMKAWAIYDKINGVAGLHPIKIAKSRTTMQKYDKMGKYVILGIPSDDESYELV